MYFFFWSICSRCTLVSFLSVYRPRAWGDLIFFNDHNFNCYFQKEYTLSYQKSHSLSIFSSGPGHEVRSNTEHWQKNFRKIVIFKSTLLSYRLSYRHGVACTLKSDKYTFWQIMHAIAKSRISSRKTDLFIKYTTFFSILENMSDSYFSSFQYILIELSHHRENLLDYMLVFSEIG